MNRFLRDTALFSLPLFAAVALWFLWYFIVGTAVESRLKKIAQYEVLIMGDSQMQRIDPQYFTSPACNLASSAEHYYFTLHKLRTITSFSDCRVQHVVLGLSAHSFSPVYNSLFDPSTPEGKRSLRGSFYFITGNDFIKAEHYRDIAILRKVLFSTPRWGGLNQSDFSDPDPEVIDKILTMHYGESGQPDPALSQRHYLKQIVNLCREKGITLTLVATPYHPYYLNNIDAAYFDALDKTLEEIGNVTWLNYIDPHLSPSLMSDANHLNNTGAAIYSKLISDTISR